MFRNKNIITAKEELLKPTFIYEKPSSKPAQSGEKKTNKTEKPLPPQIKKMVEEANKRDKNEARAIEAAYRSGLNKEAIKQQQQRFAKVGSDISKAIESIKDPKKKAKIQKQWQALTRSIQSDLSQVRTKTITQTIGAGQNLKPSFSDKLSSAPTKLKKEQITTNNSTEYLKAVNANLKALQEFATRITEAKTKPIIKEANKQLSKDRKTFGKINVLYYNLTGKKFKLISSVPDENFTTLSEATDYMRLRPQIIIEGKKAIWKHAHQIFYKIKQDPNRDPNRPPKAPGSKDLANNYMQQLRSLNPARFAQKEAVFRKMVASIKTPEDLLKGLKFTKKFETKAHVFPTQEIKRSNKERKAEKKHWQKLTSEYLHVFATGAMPTDLNAITNLKKINNHDSAKQYQQQRTQTLKTYKQKLSTEIGKLSKLNSKDLKLNPELRKILSFDLKPYNGKNIPDTVFKILKNYKGKITTAKNPAELAKLYHEIGHKLRPQIQKTLKHDIKIEEKKSTEKITLLNAIIQKNLKKISEKYGIKLKFHTDTLKNTFNFAKEGTQNNETIDSIKFNYKASKMALQNLYNGAIIEAQPAVDAKHKIWDKIKTYLRLKDPTSKVLGMIEKLQTIRQSASSKKIDHKISASQMAGQYHKVRNRIFHTLFKEQMGKSNLWHKLLHTKADSPNSATKDMEKLYAKAKKTGEKAGEDASKSAKEKQPNKNPKLARNPKSKVDQMIQGTTAERKGDTLKIKRMNRQARMYLRSWQYEPTKPVQAGQIMKFTRRNGKIEEAIAIKVDKNFKRRTGDAPVGQLMYISKSTGTRVLLLPGMSYTPQSKIEKSSAIASALKNRTKYIARIKAKHEKRRAQRKARRTRRLRNNAKRTNTQPPQRRKQAPRQMAA